MAIDTKAKRMSMLSFASPLAWGHHFEVDGSVDADDRAHLLHLYGGNVLSDPRRGELVPFSVEITQILAFDVEAVTVSVDFNAEITQIVSFSTELL